MCPLLCAPLPSRSHPDVPSARQLDDTGGRHHARAEWAALDQTDGRKCRECPAGTFAGATVPSNTTWLEQHIASFNMSDADQREHRSSGVS